MAPKPLRATSRKAAIELPETSRANFLTAAAQLYSTSLPQLSTHLGQQALLFADAQQAVVSSLTAKSQLCRKCGSPLNRHTCADVHIAWLSKGSSERLSKKLPASSTGQRGGKAANIRQKNTVVAVRVCLACQEPSVRPFLSVGLAQKHLAGEGFTDVPVTGLDLKQQAIARKQQQKERERQQHQPPQQQQQQKGSQVAQQEQAPVQSQQQQQQPEPSGQRQVLQGQLEKQQLAGNKRGLAAEGLRNSPAKRQAAATSEQQLQQVQLCHCQQQHADSLRLPQLQQQPGSSQRSAGQQQQVVQQALQLPAHPAAVQDHQRRIEETEAERGNPTTAQTINMDQQKRLVTIPSSAAAAAAAGGGGEGGGADLGMPQLKPPMLLGQKTAAAAAVADLGSSHDTISLLSDQQQQQLEQGCEPAAAGAAIGEPTEVSSLAATLAGGQAESMFAMGVADAVASELPISMAVSGSQQGVNEPPFPATADAVAPGSAAPWFLAATPNGAAAAAVVMTDTAVTAAVVTSEEADVPATVAVATQPITAEMPHSSAAADTDALVTLSAAGTADPAAAAAAAVPAGKALPDTSSPAAPTADTGGGEPNIASGFRNVVADVQLSPVSAPVPAVPVSAVLAPLAADLEQQPDLYTWQKTPTAAAAVAASEEEPPVLQANSTPDILPFNAGGQAEGTARPAIVAGNDRSGWSLLSATITGAEPPPPAAAAGAADAQGAPVMLVAPADRMDVDPLTVASTTAAGSPVPGETAAAAAAAAPPEVQAMDVCYVDMESLSQPLGAAIAAATVPTYAIQHQKQHSAVENPSAATAALENAGPGLPPTSAAAAATAGTEAALQITAAQSEHAAQQQLAATASDAGRASGGDITAVVERAPAAITATPTAAPAAAAELAGSGMRSVFESRGSKAAAAKLTAQSWPIAPGLAQDHVEAAAAAQPGLVVITDDVLPGSSEIDNAAVVARTPAQAEFAMPGAAAAAASDQPAPAAAAAAAPVVADIPTDVDMSDAAPPERAAAADDDDDLQVVSQQGDAPNPSAAAAAEVGPAPARSSPALQRATSSGIEADVSSEIDSGSDVAAASSDSDDLHDGGIPAAALVGTAPSATAVGLQVQTARATAVSADKLDATVAPAAAGAAADLPSQAGASSSDSGSASDSEPENDAAAVMPYHGPWVGGARPAHAAGYDTDTQSQSQSASRSGASSAQTSSADSASESESESAYESESQSESASEEQQSHDDLQHMSAAAAAGPVTASQRPGVSLAARRGEAQAQQIQDADEFFGDEDMVDSGSVGESENDDEDGDSAADEAEYRSDDYVSSDGDSDEADQGLEQSASEEECEDLDQDGQDQQEDVEMEDTLGQGELVDGAVAPGNNLQHQQMRVRRQKQRHLQQMMLRHVCARSHLLRKTVGRKALRHLVYR